MNKTIKQLADELGVSKTAVRNYMDDEFRAKYTTKNDKGVITITPDGCKAIAESIAKSVESNRNSFAETELITIPKSVLNTFEEQLRQKDEQIKTLNDALSKALKITDQAQHLQAGEVLKLPERARGWKFWKRNKENEQ